MTTPSITLYTEGQERQLNRFAEDAARGAVHDALKQFKISKTGAQRVISRDEFTESIYNATKELILRLSAEPASYTTAQSILGMDFITPEEVIEKVRLSRVYNEIELRALVETVPSVENLQWCKDNGYAVMPAPPSDLSLLDIHALAPGNFYSKTGDLYADHEFARKDKTTFGWLAVRKTPVPNSGKRAWHKQQQLLSGIEHVPNVAEMTWFITTYFAVRGGHLFSNVYVRTSSLDSGGNHVRTGNFDFEGLRVYHWYDDFRNSNIGVSSSRKF
jgi:hypothetical protein